jgi:heptosyltransferase-2
MRIRERILIIGPSWIGDMVIAQTLFKRLKQTSPGCVLDVVAPGWSLSLLARMPQVRQGIELRVGHGQLRIATRYRIGIRLRGQRYTWSIVLPRTFKSALIPWFAGVPRRTGYVGELRYGLLNDIRRLDTERMPLMVQRYLALAGERDEPLPLKEMPEPCLNVDGDHARQTCHKLGIDYQASTVGLAPGAEYGSAKRWPVEKFAELTKRLNQRGQPVWVFGSSKERVLGEAIIRHAGTRGVTNLCGETTLLEAVDLLSRCQALVTNDSGLMHVAAASGCKVIALYGSSTPKYTPPLTRRSTVVYHALACSPCFKRECPLGHMNCLRGITVEEVLEKLQ